MSITINKLISKGIICAFPASDYSEYYEVTNGFQLFVDGEQVDIIYYSDKDGYVFGDVPQGCFSKQTEIKGMWVNEITTIMTSWRD